MDLPLGKNPIAASGCIVSNTTQMGPFSDIIPDFYMQEPSNKRVRL